MILQVIKKRLEKNNSKLSNFKNKNPEDNEDILNSQAKKYYRTTYGKITVKNNPTTFIITFRKKSKDPMES